MGELSPSSAESASDQSRYWDPPRGLHVAAACTLGALGGLCYGVTEWYLDRYGEGVPDILRLAHDLFDWVIPVSLGMLIGSVLVLYRRQLYLNKRLSTQNTHLKSRILANTLIAHILHEIKNPIHNLSAALDQPSENSPHKDIIRRNLGRLNETLGDLRQVSWAGDNIDAAAPTRFAPWFREYLNHAVSAELRAFGIRLEKKIDPMVLFMHPLLLEQCFTVLFENAIRAVKETQSARKITVTAKRECEKHGCCVIEIRNSGKLFPKEILEKSGKSLAGGSQGMGIGLVLVHDTLDQIGGTLRLFNKESEAVVQMLIPREVPA